MEAEYLTLESMKEKFPILQSFRNGKYGWRRVNGSLNLNSCGFATEAEATKDRDRVLSDRREWSNLSF